MHDVVIRGGWIVDGTGAPKRRGDVAIDGDRLVAVGVVDAPGRREIDAAGAIVTPGWVDIHTHYDGQVTWDPELSPSGWHGVTTVVMGNCGVGFAPVRAESRDFLVQLMEGVEDIPGSALTEGMSWNWESFSEYLEEVDRSPKSIDVAAMLAHGALRGYVLGDGRPNDPATAAEIEEMCRIASEAIEAGAVGISTTRTLGHRAGDGEPAAGTFAGSDELIGIGAALKGHGRRIFSVVTDHIFTGGDTAAGEFAWMAEISRANGVPVTYMVLDIPGRPDRWKGCLSEGLELSRDGVQLVPQVAGKPASVMVGFESSDHLFSGHAGYQRLAELGYEERLTELRKPEVRAAILAEEVVPASAMMAVMHASLERIFPLSDPPNYEPAPEQSLAAIARREGISALEVAYDRMLERDGHELLYMPALGFGGGNLNNLHSMLTHPDTVLGLSDGGAHVGIICDGSMPTFMLTHWVRDRPGETLSLEQAVNIQTQRTAKLFGFDDRGVLAPGYLADVNVIDFEQLRLDTPSMAYDLPAGGKRLIQGASGYVATLKSGEIIRENDASTGAHPGKLLRGPQELRGG